MMLCLFKRVIVRGERRETFNISNKTEGGILKKKKEKEQLEFVWKIILAK